MSRSPIILMFSGQGTQYFGMCQELYDECAPFRRHVQACDELVDAQLGHRLTDILYTGVDRQLPFDRTLHTSPAVLAINYAIGKTLIELGLKPDVLLGYSLGEIMATVFAGIVSFPDALTMAITMGRLAEELAPPGAMMVVLGDESSVCTDNPDLFAGVTVACRNTERNFVVTGTPTQIAAIETVLNRCSVPAQILPVSHGFHSALIDPMKDAFIDKCESTLRASAPTIPVYSSVYNRYLTADDITPHYYWDIVRQPVLFRDSVCSLERDGPWTYVDAGPSGTLATIVRYALSSSSRSCSHAVTTPFGMDMKTLASTLRAVGLSGA